MVFETRFYARLFTISRMRSKKTAYFGLQKNFEIKKELTSRADCSAG